MFAKEYKNKLKGIKISLRGIFVLIFSLVVLSLPVASFSVEDDFIGREYLGTEWSTSVGKNIKGSPSLVDLDRDGHIEVIVLTNYDVICMDNGGRILWNLAFKGILSGKINFADLNEDGKLDLLVSEESSLICISHKGSILWEYFTEYDLENFTPCIFDINGDNHLEIIVSTAKTVSNPFVLNRKGKFLYDFDISMQYTGYWSLILGSAPTIADIDNDGILDILLVGNDFKLHAFTISGEEKWTSPIIRGDALIAVADIDGDNTVEVIIDSTIRIYCFDHNGEIEWTYTQELQNNRTNFMNYDPCIADINNDGSLEIISSAFNPLTSEGNVFCLNETGHLQWRYNSTTSVGSPCAIDLDNDGQLEVLFSEGGTNFVGLNFLGQILLYREVESIFTDPPLVADIDKDGKLEVVIARNSKNDVYCFELSESANSTGSWWTYGGSFQHHGNPDSDGDFLDDFAEVNIYKTNPHSADSDGDSLLDGWEIEYFLNPLENSTFDDPDNDGRTNLEEFERASNPTKWDNKSRLYGGYLIPVWFLSLVLIFFSYKKIKQISPKVLSVLETFYIYLRVRFARDITKQRELYIRDRDFFGDVEDALKEENGEV